MKVLLPTKFCKRAVFSAVLAAFSLNGWSEPAVASTEDWYYADSIQTGKYNDAENVLYLSNDHNALNNHNSILSFAEFQNGHSELSPARIYGLILYRGENDVATVSNNNLTFDLQDADLSKIVSIQGIYVYGTSPNNVADNNFIVIKNSSKGGASESISLVGIAVYPSDYTNDRFEGQINQEFSRNTLCIEGGAYDSISGFSIAAGRFNTNSIHVQDVLITAFTGMKSQYFYGQFENNEITLNKVSFTGSGRVYGIDLTVSSFPAEEKNFFYNNSMSITESDIEGDIALINVYLPLTNQQDINQFIETTSNNSNVLSIADSEISGYLSVYALRTNLDPSQYHPVANYGKLIASGVNKVGALAGYAQLVLNVDKTNTSSSNAVITVTDNTNTYSQQDNKSIFVNDSADPGAAYYLLATSGESTLTFNNLTIGKESTFYRESKTFNELTIGSDQALTWDDTKSWEDGKASVVDISPDPENPGDNPDSPVGGDPVITVTENSKTLSESLLGTVAFINQGAEFIADEGLSAMVESAKVGEVSAFGAVHGGSSNYKTGSRVDVDGYTLATGASIKVTPDWIIGGFVEAGWADSDSHVNGTKGKGDHDYYGIGLATRYMVNNAWYLDGSLRVGHASTEFTGLYAGDSAKYESDAFYVSAHAGTGYVINITDAVDLDVYGRYLITYLDGDDVSLHNKYDDKLDMDSTMTHALRVGGRLTGAFCPYAGWKVGVAYEHVFDGDAQSAVNSLNLEVPSLEGDTGIMEVGVTMKPSLNSRWSMDVSAKGYVGDREGVTGNVLVRYAF